MRGLEVHKTQRFADFEVLFRCEIEFSRRSDFANFDVARLVRPERHVIARRIRNDGQCVANLGIELALVLFAFGNSVFEFGDLGHQPRCGGVVLRALRLADFFRCGVSTCLRFLQRRQQRATLLVERDKALRLRLEPASPQPLVEGRGVVSDPLDIEHGGPLHGRNCEAVLYDGAQVV